MADLRSVATAVEAYAIEHDHYPLAEDLRGLAGKIEPLYIKTCPRIDGWGHPIEYEPGEGYGYVLWSPGKDGAYEDEAVGGSTMDFDCDIVFADGTFVQWPEGMQQ
jgi:hypothetical protein